MRIIFECYALYCAVIISILSGLLALGLSDNIVELLAKNIISLSLIIFGPI
jgi:hypothetical protein